MRKFNGPSVFIFSFLFFANSAFFSLLNKNFTYDVVECEKIVTLSKSKNLIHSKFFTNIASAKKNSDYDIIFSSGTIQYFKKPYEIIDEIFSSQVKFVGLSRNNFSDNEKVYSESSFIENHLPGTIGMPRKTLTICSPAQFLAFFDLNIL